MPRSEFESLIRRLETIHQLPPGGRERILSLLRTRSLAKEEFFLRAGQRATTVGFMTEGWLRYFHTDAEGREYIRYFCNGENFVSSQSALVNDEPSDFSIQAIEPSRLVVFDYKDWLTLLETDPAWGIIHTAILDEALAVAERRERSLILDDATKRYLRFLEDYPGIEAHVRQYDIASYLGISPVSLTHLQQFDFQLLYAIVT